MAFFSFRMMLSESKINKSSEKTAPGQKLGSDLSLSKGIRKLGFVRPKDHSTGKLRLHGDRDLLKSIPKRVFAQPADHQLQSIDCLDATIGRNETKVSGWK